MSVSEADRAELAHMISRAPDGLSAVYEAIGHIALERADSLPDGAERERWMLAWSLARDVFAETKRLGL